MTGRDPLLWSRSFTWPHYWPRRPQYATQSAIMGLRPPGHTRPFGNITPLASPAPVTISHLALSSVSPVTMRMGLVVSRACHDAPQALSTSTPAMIHPLDPSLILFATVRPRPRQAWPVIRPRYASDLTSCDRPFCHSVAGADHGSPPRCRPSRPRSTVRP